MSYDLKIINGDLSLKSGDLDIITGRDKLVQDILKIALTEAGSNIFNPWYGSFISQTIIGATLDENIVIDAAKSQLQNSLEKLKKIQELQLFSSLQRVDPDEHIAGISNISIVRNSVDPRLLDVVIDVITKTFSRVRTTFKIE